MDDHLHSFIYTLPLDGFILQCSDAKRSFSTVRLGYGDPPNRQRPIRPRLYATLQVEQSHFQPLPACFPRHPIHPGGRIPPLGMISGPQSFRRNI